MAFGLFRAALSSGNLPKNRIESFSDGVIAVIITILVLAIDVPPHHLNDHQLHAFLAELIPKVISYVISFLAISVWWVAHHQLFHIIRKSDRGLLWFNLIFLLFLSFTPFPTALIGEYPHSPLAVVVYGGTFFLSAISFYILRWYACFKAKLIDERIPQTALRSGLHRGLIGPVLYLLATAVGPWI
ncbi:MAG: TMEM175 family protein, partial [Acidiferrobacterales bacterium]